MAKQDYRGVKISLPVELVKAVKEKFPTEPMVQEMGDHWSYRVSEGRLDCYYSMFSEEVKDFLYESLRETDRGLASQITALRRAEKDPSNSSVANLKVLAKVIESYVKEDAIDGWLYEETGNGRNQAFLVTNVVYEEADRDSPASVQITLAYNSASSKDSSALSYTYHSFGAGIS